MENNLTVYRQVAVDALMAWNGLTKEEALKIVSTKSYSEVEGMVWAEGSITTAVKALCKLAGVTNTEEVLNAVLSKDNVFETKEQQQILNDLRNKLNEKGLLKEKNLHKAILFVLSEIHDKWVEDNASKFNKEGRENKKYQHLPLEMIGYKEATADLLFLKPLLDAMNIICNDEKLKQTYLSQVKDFFEENNIHSALDLQQWIAGGEKSYSPLKSGVNTAKSTEEAYQITNQVVEKLSKDVNVFNNTDID